MRAAGGQSAPWGRAAALAAARVERAALAPWRVAIVEAWLARRQALAARRAARFEKFDKDPMDHRPGAGFEGLAAGGAAATAAGGPGMAQGAADGERVRGPAVAMGRTAPAGLGRDAGATPAWVVTRLDEGPGWRREVVRRAVRADAAPGLGAGSGPTRRDGV